jgi:hypothetical protein
MSKNEEIDQCSSKFAFLLNCTIIHDFSSHDWCIFFCILLHSLEDLLLTILVEGDMLSSLSGLIQPVREGRLDTGSWAIEWSSQCIDGDWDIVTRFCNVLHRCNLLVSKFKSSKIRTPLENPADLTCKAKQFEAWHDDMERERGRRGRVSQHFLAFNVTVILLASHIWCFRRMPSPLKLFDAGKFFFCLVDLALGGIFFFTSSADIRLSLGDPLS